MVMFLTSAFRTVEHMRFNSRRIPPPLFFVPAGMLITFAAVLFAAGLVASTPASANRVSAVSVRAVRYGPQPRQLLDLYLPQRTDRTSRLPTIVWLHSGGWIAGSRANVATVANAQLARGYAIASIDYQLATPGGSGSFPGAVYDVKTAVRFLKAHASTWTLNPTQVILMGSSAGGHLAALSGASGDQLEPDLTGPLADVDSRVVAIVDIVGPTDLAQFATTRHPWAAPLTADFLGCPIHNDRAACPSKLLHMASVAPYISAASPPIFMAYGTADNLVVPSTQGAPLARAWIQAHHGDPHSADYEVVPGGGHNNIGAGQIDMSDLDQFLDHAVGRS
jgi:acetyl esterase/lipase